MHIDVTRPCQTDSENLTLPIIYVSRPYFAGTSGIVEVLMWNVKHELGKIPKERNHPELVRKGKRPIISNSHINTWVPRGYIVVHSSSPGT
jgi:X-Pro dipeptidyl-peptidase